MAKFLSLAFTAISPLLIIVAGHLAETKKQGADVVGPSKEIWIEIESVKPARHPSPVHHLLH